MSFLPAKFLHDFADTYSVFHYLEGPSKFLLNNLFNEACLTEISVLYSPCVYRLMALRQNGLRTSAIYSAESVLCLRILEPYAQCLPQTLLGLSFTTRVAYNVVSLSARYRGINEYRFFSAAIISKYPANHRWGLCQKIGSTEVFFMCYSFIFVLLRSVRIYGHIYVYRVYVSHSHTRASPVAT